MFFQNISCSIKTVISSSKCYHSIPLKKHLRHKKYFLGEYWYSLKFRLWLKKETKPNIKNPNQKTPTKQLLKKKNSAFFFTSYIFTLLCLYNTEQKSYVLSDTDLFFFFFSVLGLIGYCWSMAQNYVWKLLFFEQLTPYPNIIHTTKCTRREK